MPFHYDRDPFLQLMLSRSGLEGWLLLMVFAGLLLAALYRRESIVSLIKFRLAVVLLALAVIVPSITNAVVFSIVSYGVSISTNSADMMILQAVAGSIGPVLTVASFLCMFGAVLPQRQMPTSAVAQKHPLDD